MLFYKCFVLSLCCVSLVRSQSGFEVQRWPGVRVSVSSSCNLTRHWTTEVCLRHADDGKHRSGSWLVDIEPSTSICGGRSTHDVKLTFTSPGVAAGYEYIPNFGHYKFHTSAVVWPRAKQACEEEGGHLVIINSEEEDKAMMILFGRHWNISEALYKDYAWIGAREKDNTNGEYLTVFGKPLATTGFLRWHGKEPDETSPGDYMWINRVTGGLGDDGIAKANKFAFICEYGTC